MPNPGGANQLGGYQIQPKYGDVKKQTQLTRSAPISGAPLSAHAIDTPRRSSRHAQHPQRPEQAPAPENAAAGPAPPPPRPEMEQATVWAQLASVPGASPLVQQLAIEAQRAAG